MRDYARLKRFYLLTVLAAGVVFLVGCNGVSTRANSDPPANTYLYVAEGNVAQLQVQSDGTLTPLNPPTVAGPAIYGTNFITVDPSGQHLFASLAVAGAPSGVNQYVIGSDGTLTPNNTPAITLEGNDQLAFTPNGQFTFSADFVSGQFYTYGLSSSGSLSLVSQSSISATGTQGVPEAVDPTGRFLYAFSVATPNYFNYWIFEYSISTDGMLTPLTPNYVVAAGWTDQLAVSSNGFLYTPNFEDGTVTAFWIDESTGQLANAGSFASGTGAGSGPSSIVFNPAGTYAYVANSADGSVSQFSVNATTGALSMIAPDVPAGTYPSQAIVDPSGKFAFVTNAGGTISQYTINSNGSLAPNGTYNLGSVQPSSMAFAQR